LVLIDCRGHGDSSKPHGPEAYDDQRLAADVAAVLNALGAASADIYGHSMGGAIALAFAARHHHRVRSLIVNGAHPFEQDLSVLRALIDADIEPWIAHLRSKNWPLSNADLLRLRGNDLGALRACVAHDRPDRSERFAGFNRPMLAIGGESDPLCPRLREFVTLTGADYLELAGCNHFQAFLEVEKTCARIEAFLAGLCKLPV
jgi:pimeloyl-ACP methyl ester carboxylesterase